VIEPFEAALADVLADRIGALADVLAIARPTGGVPALAADAARVTVSVVDATGPHRLGDDRDERLGQAELRATLRLAGRVRVAVEVAEGGAAGRRAVLWRATDAVLVALHDDAIHTGRFWGDAHAQGFAIDRFRLARVGEPVAEAATPDGRRIEVWYDFEGRFWPTEPVVEGDVIAAPIRSRLVLLDADLPDGVVAHSAGPEVVVPVGLDLRAWGGTEPRLVARLAGAAPPGQLLGDGAGVPAGSIGYLPGDDGRFAVRFRAAAALATPAVARVLLSLAAADRPTVRIGELRIAVRP